MECSHWDQRFEACHVWQLIRNWPWDVVPAQVQHMKVDRMAKAWQDWPNKEGGKLLTLIVLQNFASWILLEDNGRPSVLLVTAHSSHWLEPKSSSVWSSWEAPHWRNCLIGQGTRDSSDSLARVGYSHLTCSMKCPEIDIFQAMSNVYLLERQGHRERDGVRWPLRQEARARWFTKLADRREWVASSRRARWALPDVSASWWWKMGWGCQEGLGSNDVACREGGSGRRHRGRLARTTSIFSVYLTEDKFYSQKFYCSWWRISKNCWTLDI